MTWELILDGYSESSYSATPRFAAARLPWFRDQVAAGRQQLEHGNVLPHDMVESSAAAWRDEMSRKVAGK
ncbi:hypothetical protein [Escherichia coli]|uniref:hypothetical protein n=1 Tax=Escherichia coli TaxID=562 RepID=UPI0035270B7C